MTDGPLPKINPSDPSAEVDDAVAAGKAPEGSAPDAGAPTQSAEAACAAQNGTLQRVGRMQSVQCVIAYADAGKRCTDGDQCQGDCRIEGNSGVTPGTAATGVCQATSDRFGCHTTVEDGKAGPTLCID